MASGSTRLAAVRAKLRVQVLEAPTAYAVLGVPPGASADMIKGAHRALASAFHPDRCGLADASDLMARVNVAYETLTDPAKRRTHDTIHHTAKRACPVCDGTGFTLKQRGFKAKVKVPCGPCGGSGCQ